MPRFLPSFGGAPLPLSWVSLKTLAVGWSRHLLFLGPSLGFFPLASGVGC